MSALACLVALHCFVDDIDTPTTAHHAIVAMALAKRFDRVPYLHGAQPNPRALSPVGRHHIQCHCPARDLDRRGPRPASQPLDSARRARPSSLLFGIFRRRAPSLETQREAAQARRPAQPSQRGCAGSISLCHRTLFRRAPRVTIRVAIGPGPTSSCQTIRQTVRRPICRCGCGRGGWNTLRSPSRRDR